MKEFVDLLESKTGAEVYALHLPQSPTLPAVVYRVISSYPLKAHESVDLTNTLFECGVVAETYAEAKDIKDAMQLELHGYKDTDFYAVFFERSYDSYDYEPDLFSITADIRVWHTQGYSSP